MRNNNYRTELIKVRKRMRPLSGIFSISLFACSHNTRSPASDYIRCIRTRVFKMQTPDMLKIPESGLIHFLLYWLHYKKILTITLINSIKK